jgi:hypothetical protein
MTTNLDKYAEAFVESFDVDPAVLPKARNLPWTLCEPL